MKEGDVETEVVTADEKLARVRKMLLEEIRRLTRDDVDTGRRGWRRGVTARAVSAERLTYIIEATGD